MKRSSGAGRLTALSTVMAGVLMASAAYGSPASSEQNVTPAAGVLPQVAVVDMRLAGSKAAGSGSSGTETAVERCRTGALAARVGAVDAGAGQRYAPLVVTNRSARTCWVYGFVGLIMIDRNGDALRTRTRRESVQPHRVTLRPGAGAHARLHWTEVPSGRETRCPAAARLMIIPPDEVAHLEIPFTAAVCDDGRLDITPMAPGTRL
ncbi:DUF4232 domain-containing protein [Streptosporangium roseum]|uniref:DUF4232 domain-containing protein n=1 Tax=Streptosporangium roseum TaxID=2001 RepID=UPI00068C3061|nr:DUF4232 domain-containing protein [Streptosporangium roseum]